MSISTSLLDVAVGGVLGMGGGLVQSVVSARATRRQMRTAYLRDQRGRKADMLQLLYSSMNINLARLCMAINRVTSMGTPSIERELAQSGEGLDRTLSDILRSSGEASLAGGDKAVSKAATAAVDCVVRWQNCRANVDEAKNEVVTLQAAIEDINDRAAQETRNLREDGKD